MGIESCLSTKLSSWKKIWQFFFWSKCLHQVLLLMYGEWKRVNGRSFDNIKKFALASFYKWKKKKQISIAVKRNLCEIRLLEIIVKPGIYVICDKHEFLCSHFSIVKILQLNSKFKRLVVSPQCITLLVNFMLTVVEKGFFTLINLNACP